VNGHNTLWSRAFTSIPPARSKFAAHCRHQNQIWNI